MVEELYPDSELINKRKEKNRSNDRVFVLEPIEGKFTLTQAGHIDTSIFKGKNNIHALINEFGNWYLKMDHGMLPSGLKQQWTSFTKLEHFVKEYYLKRNVRVKDILD